MTPSLAISRETNLESIHRRKTGALFRVSLRLGAIVAERLDRATASARSVRQHLGLAFQVVDDLLDVSGSEGDVGKRLNKDSQQGKATYPAVLGEAASRELAGELIDQACDAIDHFWRVGRPLRELALFVRRRNN